MANVKVSLEGSGRMKRRFEHAIQEMPKELRRVLKTVAERKLAIMQARTPVRTGRLLRSEKIRVMVSGKREDFRISLVAGGPEAPHARVVHEIHKTKKKFMESVVLEAVPTLGAEVARELDLKRVVSA